MNSPIGIDIRAEAHEQIAADLRFQFRIGDGSSGAELEDLNERALRRAVTLDHERKSERQN